MFPRKIKTRGTWGLTESGDPVRVDMEPAVEEPPVVHPVDAALFGLEEPTDIDLIIEGLESVERATRDKRSRVKYKQSKESDSVVIVTLQAAIDHYDRMLARIETLQKDMLRPGAMVVVNVEEAIRELKLDESELRTA